MEHLNWMEDKNKKQMNFFVPFEIICINRNHCTPEETQILANTGRW